MTSNEETIRKFAEAFDEAFGDECKAAYITVVPELGKGPLLDDPAKLFASNDWKPLGTVIDGEGPMLPNGKTLADMFASSDRKPLGTVIDDEDDEEEDDGPDDAGELDELEHMRDVADMAYVALSDLALHCHNRREDVAWGIASSAAKDAHGLATFVGDWIEDMEDED